MARTSKRVAHLAAKVLRSSPSKAMRELAGAALRERQNIRRKKTGRY